VLIDSSTASEAVSDEADGAQAVHVAASLRFDVIERP
jgi:hypothetical protein